MSDIEEIKALIAERERAIAAGDVDAIVAPLDEEVVTYGLAPPLAFSGAEARDKQGLGDWLATWEAPPRIAYREPRILIDGDLAVAFGLASMTGAKVGSSETRMWYRVTTIFARRGGSWRIVHEHESVPFRMDGSDLAELDLVP